MKTNLYIVGKDINEILKLKILKMVFIILCKVIKIIIFTIQLNVQYKLIAIVCIY